jgi:hydroxymethylpyrimidine/phosphomethylpyrimidine kinase
MELLWKAAQSFKKSPADFNSIRSDRVFVPSSKSLPELHSESSSKPAPAQSPRVVLSIAGYDPSAGAGVLADLKTFAANGVFGMACVTALTVQSTQEVRRVQPLEPDIVVETLNCLAQDVRFFTIKVGMLGGHAVAAAVLDWLRDRPEVAVVLDPVVKSSSSKELLDRPGIEALRKEWLTRVNWITPNLTELAILTGSPVPTTQAETEEAAQLLQRMAALSGNSGLKIVVTGGHAEKPDDLLLNAAGCRWFRGERIETTSSHGTGCAFSSALAARLALGEGDFDAVESAKEYVAGALRCAYPIGRGKGPLNHFWQSGFHG